MEIDIKEYFTEIIDESRSTIGYSLNPYKDIELVKAIYEQNEQLQQLKEENEELKEKLKNCANENLNEIYELIKKNDCWRGIVNVVNERLEQKLEKIEEIVKEFNNKSGVIDYAGDEILQIIRGKSE